ncbi:MAG: hypothetical protein IKS48_11270 [Eubacterium sp.]|nr:hypothetical protein [Eubacterium sp.]
MRKDAIEEEIKASYISERHYSGLIEYMTNRKMIVAFRPAGRHTIDKLALGAAAKPHKILAKTIKPEEVALRNPVIFRKADFHVNNIDQAKGALCGLVGRRNEYGQVVGVYLSSKGVERFSDEYDIRHVEGTNQGYIEFDRIETLLDWIIKVLKESEEETYDIFKYFIAGDYDMHEVLRVVSDTEIEHFPADSISEAKMLYGMSRAAVGEFVDEELIERFEPLEFSPIQHGAQDNYIDHTYISEPYVPIVEKVALPSLEIAFFNGIDGTWVELNNDIDIESVYVNKSVDQSKDIREYLQMWGTDIADHWKIEDDEILASLLHSVDRTYLQDVADRIWE